MALMYRKHYITDAQTTCQLNAVTGAKGEKSHHARCIQHIGSIMLHLNWFFVNIWPMSTQKETKALKDPSVQSSKEEPQKHH